MTARQPPRPDGLNRNGNGRGLKKVTKPLTKKRGASADRKPFIEENRRKYAGRSLSNMPVAEVALLETHPLTDKAKLFVKYWAQGESITSASARAGYGDGAAYAYKVAKLPSALALYDAEKKAYEEASQMTRKRVMDGLLEGVELAKLMAEPASVIAGWREIGKMCGYYEPIRKKIDVNLSGNVVMERMNKLSDAELLKLITQTIERGEAEDDEEE